MADITHGTWIKGGKSVDAAYQSGVKVYGRNLLTGTSGTLQTVTNAVGYNGNLQNFIPTSATIDSDAVYTARAWIAPASYDIFVQMMWKDPSGAEHYNNGNTISGGTSGYSTLTMKFTAGSIIQRVKIVFAVSQSTASTVSYKEVKLEKGSAATDWSPAPEDVI